MNDTRGIGDNLPPLTPLTELVSETVIAEHIAAELDREPDSPDGGKLRSIRDRDVELEGMLKRLLAAHPKIETDAVESLISQALAECGDFAGGTGRVEKAREALKRPVWNAGKQIDEKFGKFGNQLEIRPPTGPANKRRQAPFTLAEQINMRLAAYKDEKATRIRLAAQAEAKAKADQAALLERMASRGSSTVTLEDAAEAQRASDAAQAIADAPAAALTRSHGGDFGTTSLRRIRTFTVVNPGIVPRHLCVPSDALIREAIGKADGPMPKIEGIEISDISDLNRG
jgi:hypothetical protein